MVLEKWMDDGEKERRNGDCCAHGTRNKKASTEGTCMYRSIASDRVFVVKCIIVHENQK